MNLVLLSEEELQALAHVLTLAAGDRRARHICTVLKPAPGAELKVGAVNRGVGKAKVKVLDSGEVELWGLSTLLALPATPHLELLLAMPRPKVMMRLWSVMAQLGVRRVVLTNAWRVEKAYFSSQATDHKKYMPELLEGLEQAVCTTLPDVRIEMRLKPFVEDQLDVLFPSSSFLRLFCHPGSGLYLTEAIERAARARRRTCGASGAPLAVLLAVGPEGGWVDYEVELFRRANFVQVTLGRRILTTELAVASLGSLAVEALARSERPSWQSILSGVARTLCCS